MDAQDRQDGGHVCFRFGANLLTEELPSQESTHSHPVYPVHLCSSSHGPIAFYLLNCRRSFWHLEKAVAVRVPGALVTTDRKWSGAIKQS